MSCQLHKCGMNFSFFTENFCKTRLVFLQTQALVCLDQIIALMILACKCSYGAQYSPVSHVEESFPSLPVACMEGRFSLYFACLRVVTCCVFVSVGNLRGFNMTAPALQQFFPQATRHSLLGPPPVGVSLKPTRLGFPSLPFQRQNRMFRKVSLIDHSLAFFEVFLFTFNEQVIALKKNSLPFSYCPSQIRIGLPPLVSHFYFLFHRSISLWPGIPASFFISGFSHFCFFSYVPSVCLEQHPHSSAESTHLQILLEHPVLLAWPDKYPYNTISSLAPACDGFCSPRLLPRFVLSSGGSLKVTIQQSSESRAISTTALKPGHWTCEVGTADPSPESVLKFYCYICKTNCCSQQNFQSHMAGIQHQQRLGEIQHMSNVCFVSLLPMVKEQKLETQQRWCNTCQIHFTGDLIKHRRTQEHKLAKRSLRPFCTVCSRHFKTPRKFVEHMKSPEHKQKAKELGSPEDSEELITVDAVGCFEDDEEEEEEEGIGEDEDDLDVVLVENEDSAAKQVCLDFLVPVAGYLCRLCHKFYHSDSAARLAHCKSLMHFENFQKSGNLTSQHTVMEATSCTSTFGPQGQPATGSQSV
uniref:Matrin-type domain-containing protein n=1 Tax=Anser cygnoides TaxID=8845 RepID=A0A8B9EM92_ANSCY